MNLKDTLNKHNFKFKKKFGQNFLLDDNILNNITNLGDIDEDTLVIEVGVGAAALTKKTALKAGKVLGYEIDESLKEIIEKQLETRDNVEIIYNFKILDNVVANLGKKEN